MREPRRRPALHSANPQALTREELRRLAKAERKLASPDRAQAASGVREIQDLERRHGERVESQSLAARLAETSSLALSRGEEVRSETVRLAVAQFDEHGARIVRHGLPLYRQETHARVRITSRGGLQLAFERGDLDGGRVKAERLHETGKAYRWAFETASALTTSPRNLAAIGGRSPLRASAGPQDAVFAAGEILRIFRADLTARQVVVLDSVCGLDSTVRATALLLRADARTVRRLLVEALTVATDSKAASRPAPA
ncbi:MAG TPA: hypothetical protein VN814_19670 [Caulobacteraceae bacterium]|nr:hypothetical protein [Caulobacteraceae bacterium]